MARYRFSIDLGIFTGARFLSLTLTEGGKPIPGIFIPAGINGIEVKNDDREESKRNPSLFRAFINLRQVFCNNKYLDAVKQSLLRKGENITLYNVPAFNVAYSLPEDRRKVIRAALAKRVIAEHPEWANQSDEKGTELAGAISRMMPFNMGDSYLIEEQAQTSATPATNAAPTATPTTSWAPPSGTDYDPFSAGDAPDDLPF